MCPVRFLAHTLRRRGRSLPAGWSSGIARLGRRSFGGNGSISKPVHGATAQQGARRREVGDGHSRNASIACRPSRRGGLNRLVSAWPAGRPSALHAPESWQRRPARMVPPGGPSPYGIRTPAVSLINHGNRPNHRSGERHGNPALRRAVRSRRGSKVARPSTPQRTDVPSITADQRAHAACPGWQEPGRPDGDGAPGWR